jgi:hypothetical protein
MKNTIKVFGIIALVAVIGLGVAACGDEPDDTPPSPPPVFTSLSEFKTWLDKKPENTQAKPYPVVLKLDDLGGDSETEGSLGYILRVGSYDPPKYISLDISGCTITVIGDRAFGYCSNLTGIKIPNGIISIGDHAFENCGSLTGINIPNGVTSIGEQAFDYCGLTVINIPGSVRSIGRSSNDCENLKAINVDADNTEYSSEGGILYNKDKTTLLRCPQKMDSSTSARIPDSVKVIGESAFHGCSNFRQSIWQGITDIKNDAFSYSGLTGFTSHTVTSIGNFAFIGCENLTELDIGMHLASLGDMSFAGSPKLTKITIWADNVDITRAFLKGDFGDLSEKYEEHQHGIYTTEDLCTYDTKWTWAPIGDTQRNGG